MCWIAQCLASNHRPTFVSVSGQSRSVTGWRGPFPAGGPHPSLVTGCLCRVVGHAPPVPTVTAVRLVRARRCGWMKGMIWLSLVVLWVRYLVSTLDPIPLLLNISSPPQVLGLQRSFSCGDIVSLGPVPLLPYLSRSDTWLLSAECDYSWAGAGARLDANSRSLSTWVAVGDVDEVNSQLPSPHVEMIKVWHGRRNNPDPCMSLYAGP